MKNVFILSLVTAGQDIERVIRRPWKPKQNDVPGEMGSAQIVKLSRYSLPNTHHQVHSRREYTTGTQQEELPSRRTASQIVVIHVEIELECQATASKRLIFSLKWRVYIFHQQLIFASKLFTTHLVYRFFWSLH